nr:hypothetical protein [Candidatus Acidoferrales bacterium]
MQRAAWSFHAVHTQYGVARAAGDIANDEKAIMAKFESAITVFNQDYDLPLVLSNDTKEELGKINIALANMMAFSMTGQAADIKTAVTQIQDSSRLRLSRFK